MRLSISRICMVIAMMGMLLLAACGIVSRDTFP